MYASGPTCSVENGQTEEVREAERFADTTQEQMRGDDDGERSDDGERWDLGCII